MRDPDRESKELLGLCRAKLIEARAEALNRLMSLRGALSQQERGGDEVDQSVGLLEENNNLTLTHRLRVHLFEIDSALARIELGHYGLCEETGEPIEPQRLLALPWTRLSIEGAEIRESLNRGYSR